MQDASKYARSTTQPASTAPQPQLHMQTIHLSSGVFVSLRRASSQHWETWRSTARPQITQEWCDPHSQRDVYKKNDPRLNVVCCGKRQPSSPWTLSSTLLVGMTNAIISLVRETCVTSELLKGTWSYHSTKKAKPHTRIVRKVKSLVPRSGKEQNKNFKSRSGDHGCQK